MMKNSTRWLVSLTTAIAFIFVTPMAESAALPWRNGPYTYQADNIPVNKVIQDFCATMGVKAQIDSDISSIVNGKLSAASGQEFLELFMANYGLAWYYYAGVLHVSKQTNQVTKTFSVAADTIKGLKQALTDLGVLDARFGWAEIGQQGMIIVSGPPEYVRIVAKTIDALPLSANGQKVVVFRLKYASVEDRTIFFRDKQRTVIGMASLLKSLITPSKGGAAPRAASGDQISPPSPLPTPLPSILGSLTEPLPSPALNASSGNTESQKEPSGTKTKTGESAPPPFEAGAGASIESDTRLNAIIVKDSPDRIPMYEKLIAMLDIPVAMVEIEARILDVSKTKLRELGFDWGIAAKNATFAFGAPTQAPATSGLSDFSLGIHARVTSNTVVLDSASYLLSRIHALESQGDANTLARPSILTTDNLGALIDLSQTVYAEVKGERVANLVPVTVGTMLKVTPHVIEHDGERYIQLVIDIEDGTMINQASTGLPIVQKSTLATQAVILENQSLLIAGYNRENTQSTQLHVPVLSNIPLLGPLFSSTQANRDNSERLFLLTPRIVNPLVLAQNAAQNSTKASPQTSSMHAPQPAQPPSIQAPQPVQSPLIQAPQPVLPPSIQTPQLAPQPSVEEPVPQIKQSAAPASVARSLTVHPTYNRGPRRPDNYD